MSGAAIGMRLGRVDAGAAQRPATDGGFTEIYETHYNRLFGFVYSRVRSVDLTKDLLSEIFEKAYLKGHAVREQSAYGAWLFMIAKNTIAGHFRRQRREFTCRDKVKDSLRFEDRTMDPEDFALQGERIALLMKQVRTLPERDQDLLSLKFDAELTHVEIARVMGMTPLNVRVSIFRALRRLKARMEKDAA